MEPRPKSLALLLTVLGGLTLLTTVGIALGPALAIHQPLLLLVMSPVDRHLLLAGHVVPMPLFVLIVTLRRLLSSAVGYGIGIGHGTRGLRWIRERYPRLRGLLVPVARRMRRTVPFILFMTPWPALCGFLAGAVRIRAWTFGSLAAVGQIVWALVWYQASQALGTWIEPVMRVLGKHVWWATAATVLIVAIFAWRRRQKRGVDAELDPEASSSSTP